MKEICTKKCMARGMIKIIPDTDYLSLWENHFDPNTTKVA
jgi:hypothetical protein